MHRHFKGNLCGWPLTSQPCPQRNPGEPCTEGRPQVQPHLSHLQTRPAKSRQSPSRSRAFGGGAFREPGSRPDPTRHCSAPAGGHRPPKEKGGT